jgi:hypothetical protein
MYVLHNPKKKATSYVAKITNDLNKPIRLKIPYCKIQYLREQPANGHLLRIVIPKDSEQYSKIEDIDKTICENAINNNQKWFSNNLQIDQIKEFYRPSLNIIQNTMTLMIIDIKDTIISMNDKVVDSIEEINYNNPDIYLSLEIEAQGLYFFPKKFGIRWIVNKIAFYNESLINNDNDEIIDKESIEEEWDKEISQIKEVIKGDIQLLTDKINVLSTFTHDLDNIFENAKKEESTEQWNILLNQLSHKIVKYHSGRNIITQ